MSRQVVLNAVALVWILPNLSCTCQGQALVSACSGFMWGRSSAGCPGTSIVAALTGRST